VNIQYDPRWPTNYHDWYHAIGAADHNVALWATFHERYFNDFHELESLPWWQKVDKIFILGQEATHVDWVHKDPRIWVWDSRYLPDLPRFHSFFWWWWQTVEVERYQLGSQRLHDPRIQPPHYHFECAIRVKNTPHRLFAHAAIEQSDLLKDACLIRHTDAPRLPGTDIEVQCLQERGRIDVMPVYGHGNARASIQVWVPYLLYNQAWFSVLSESWCDYNFFTEKTAKLLLARRMFVAIAAPYLLRELKAMGFQTFDLVVDESYDEVEDDTTRWQMALDQITKICAQDPRKIYDKILPVLEHNRAHLLSEDMVHRAQRQMISVLNDK
jgi:hypothetical protein